MNEVMPFPHICRRNADPKHPVLDVLETYWRTLRMGTQAPARHRIDPAAIDTSLPWTFMLQAAGTGDGRVRVAGQKLHDITGLDPRGMMISALFAQSDRAAVRGLIATAFEEPALVMVPLVARGGLLRSDKQGAALFLPLVDDHGLVTRMLGALVCDGASQTRGFAMSHDLPTRVEPLHASTAISFGQSNGPDAIQHPTLRLVVNNG